MTQIKEALKLLDLMGTPPIAQDQRLLLEAKGLLEKAAGALREENERLRERMNNVAGILKVTIDNASSWDMDALRDNIDLARSYLLDGAALNRT